MDPSGLWHVRLSVGGGEQPVADVRAAMERLSEERPFMLSGRYGGELAEFSYWERCELYLPHALLCVQWIEQNSKR